MKEQYDDCIRTINQLTEHIKILSNQHQLQNLEDIAQPQQYLNLLANSLYAVNSLAYSYANLKNTTLPPEFVAIPLLSPKFNSFTKWRKTHLQVSQLVPNPPLWSIKRLQKESFSIHYSDTYSLFVFSPIISIQVIYNLHFVSRIAHVDARHVVVSRRRVDHF